MTEYREMSQREKFMKLAKWYLNGWILPPGFHRLREKWRVRQASRLSREEKAVLSRNKRFQGMYKGRRCFVIGNGPSLKAEDLSPLKHEITITMNFFNRHPVIAEWQPTFYCAAEPAERLKLVRPYGMLERLSPTAAFFQIGARSLFDDDKTPEGSEVYYLKLSGERLERKPPPRYRLDISTVMPHVQNTAEMAIMLALELGCSPICLLGLDYDWLSHRSYHRHFYDAQDPIETLEDMRGRTYLEAIEQMTSDLLYHQALAELGRLRGQEVINATRGSFLDVYPMASFQEVMATSP